MTLHENDISPISITVVILFVVFDFYILAVHKNNSQVNIIVLQINELVHYYINHWYNTDIVACNCF